MLKQFLFFALFCISHAIYSQNLTKIDLDSQSKIKELKSLLKDLPSRGTISKKNEIRQIFLGEEKLLDNNYDFRFNNLGYFAVYYDKKLVFFMDSKWENSRMGSCGDISIENYYFIEDEEIKKVYHVEKNSSCYNLEPLNMLAILSILN